PLSTLFTTTFFSYSAHHRHLHSFPTRRSSDLAPLKDHLADGGLGHISEILDGDSPQRPCGCIAQAWSVAEILRALVEDVYGLRPMPQPQVPAAQARGATAVRTAVSRQTGMRTGASP